MKNSMFTKRHYEEIAETLRASHPPIKEEIASREHYALCVKLAEMFRKDNSAFDKHKFLTACGWDT